MKPELKQLLSIIIDKLKSHVDEDDVYDDLPHEEQLSEMLQKEEIVKPKQTIKEYILKDKSLAREALDKDREYLDKEQEGMDELRAKIADEHYSMQRAKQELNS